MFGLLGPNGAGKTTLVKVLATLLKPTGGRAAILGHDVVAEPLAVRRRIGLAGQFAAVDEELTGRENLEMVGRLYRLPVKEAKARAADVLERFGLTEAADRRVSTYSGGMRRRLDLGASPHRPPAGDAARRADDGSRPAHAPGAVEHRRPAAPRRHDRPADHPVPGGGRPARAADRGRRPRPDRGRGHGEGAQGDDRRRGALGARRPRPCGRTPPRCSRTSPTSRSSIPPRARSASPSTDPSASAEAVRRLDAKGLPIAAIELQQPSLDDVFLSLTGKKAA